MSYTREQIEDEAFNGEWDDVHRDMLRQLLAENDALREDAARMDFVEANPNTPLSFHRRTKWCIRTSFNYENECFPTARQAIDAARKGDR